MYHQKKVQIDDSAVWVRIPSTNIISLPLTVIKSPTACWKFTINCRYWKSNSNPIYS